MFLLKVVTCSCQEHVLLESYENWQVWTCLLHLKVTSTCRIKNKKKATKRKNANNYIFCSITRWLGQILLCLTNMLYHFWQLLQRDWEQKWGYYCSPWHKTLLKWCFLQSLSWNLQIYLTFLWIENMACQSILTQWKEKPNILSLDPTGIYFFLMINFTI